MDVTALFDRLLTAGIIHESDDEDTVWIDEAFTEAVEENRERLQSTDDRETWIRDRVGESSTTDALLRVAEDAPELVASYLALRSRLADIPSEEMVRLALVLSQLRSDDAPTGGVPEPFLPVRGDQLPLLLDLQPLAVIYCWREDCDPCDGMKEALESAFAEPPEDVSLLSVYGPDCARRLQEEYDVMGAPTTLFVVNGRVDSRLHGAHYPETIEREVEKIHS